MKKLFILTLAVFTAFSTFLVKGPAIEASVEYKEVYGYGELESPIVENNDNNIYRLKNGKYVYIYGTTVTEVELESPIKLHLGYSVYELENGKYVYIAGTTVTEIELESPIKLHLGDSIYELENGKYVFIYGTTVTEIELESPIKLHLGDSIYELENGKYVYIYNTTVTEIELESPIATYIGSFLYELENGKYVYIYGTTVTEIELESPIATYIGSFLYELENGKYVYIYDTTVTEIELESPILEYLMYDDNDDYIWLLLENKRILRITGDYDLSYYNVKVEFENNILKGNGFNIVINGQEITKFYHPDERNPYPDWERDGNDFYYYTGKLGNSSAQGDHLVIESPNGRDLEYLSWLDVNGGTQIWRKFENYNEKVYPDNPDYTKVALMHETVGEVKTLSFYRPASIVDGVTTYEAYGSVWAPPSAFDIIQIRVPLTYDVKYYVDSELYETQRVKALQTLIPPKAPEKENNIFLGWYADPDTKIPFDRYTPIDQQTELYAKFTPTTTGSTVVPGEDKPFDFMIPINIILIGGLAVLLVVAYKKKGKRR